MKTSRLLQKQGHFSPGDFYQLIHILKSTGSDSANVLTNFLELSGLAHLTMRPVNLQEVRKWLRF